MRAIAPISIKRPIYFYQHESNIRPSKCGCHKSNMLFDAKFGAPKYVVQAFDFYIIIAYI